MMTPPLRSANARARTPLRSSTLGDGGCRRHFLSLLLALVFQDPFAGDWDALDYTVLALRGEPSSMLLGRMLFIFTNRGIWTLAHALFEVPPAQSYLLFKYAVILQCPLATIACWALARELTHNVQSATIAALLIISSPLFVIYSGQAMTEIPSIFLLATALHNSLARIDATVRPDGAAWRLPARCER
ncbi:MAG: hypothetical protein WKF84_01590 [Pyrinomonadaceae bacterium]